MVSEVDWTFDGRWPYEAQFFDSADGRLAYARGEPTQNRSCSCTGTRPGAISTGG
jgi:hypothetical protein